MKEKKSKLKLDDIKVESLVTSLNENKSNDLLGGTGDQTMYTAGNTTCGQAPGCVSWGGTCACSTSPICGD